MSRSRDAAVSPWSPSARRSGKNLRASASQLKTRLDGQTTRTVPFGAAAASAWEPMRIAFFDTHRYDRASFEAANARFGHALTFFEPRLTRPKLIGALRMLANKRDTMPRKKHGNIPL